MVMLEGSWVDRRVISVQTFVHLLWSILNKWYGMYATQTPVFREQNGGVRLTQKRQTLAAHQVDTAPSRPLLRVFPTSLVNTRSMHDTRGGIGYVTRLPYD